jgi:hypothetical protein
MAKRKDARSAERRAVVERLRAEQQRRERIRSRAVLAACVIAVVGLLGVAVVKYLDEPEAADPSALGVPAGDAGCDAITTKQPTGLERSGVKGNHVEIGTTIRYPDSPPAFGQHWPNWLTSSEYRSFYSPRDRPELERMVHSLEHGHTLIWYVDTIKPGSKEYQDLQAIANEYDGTTTYVNILPWKSTDGSAFRDGKHVVLTHWAGSDDDQKGIWQYCSKPSGAVINDFVKEYPNTDAPEGGAQ